MTGWTRVLPTLAALVAVAGLAVIAQRDDNSTTPSAPSLESAVAHDVAVAEEVWWRRHQTYTASIANLQSVGLNNSSGFGFDIDIVRADISRYCLEIRSPAIALAHYDNADGVVRDGGC